MSLVYLHMLVQRCHSCRFILRKFAASNFAISNFHLVTSKIHYFKFHYLDFSRKIMNFLFRTPRNNFQKFDNFSWKIHKNKGQISKYFACISFAQYRNWLSMISLVLTKKSTSNEYLSINSKKRFNKKTVLPCEQCYLIETCSHKLKSFAQTLMVWT